MTQLLHIHPTHPQARLINQVVAVLQQGGVIAYPTDSAYALGCHLGDKNALERIKKLRELDKNHNFTLVCQNLSEIGTYAQVSNSIFRLLKANTPGAYTFILPASQEVPRRLQHPKRKTIGLRVPDNTIALEILKALNEPLMSVTLILPGDAIPLFDPETILERLQGQVDLIVDGGYCEIEPTTVVDLVEGVAKIIRVGKGDPAPFQ
ncbi:MAG TPA: L-threonylcarbamoyladenylate synthase [Gammaproteobacteria bacterium]|nr:L-threonylcarbamoyladenylate synthase [Gammaproteobacteria bacterium]